MEGGIILESLLLPIAAVILLVFVAILCLGKPLRWLATLGVRTGAGLMVLQGLQWVGPTLGIYLGTNILNAVTLGVLGLPGFGLLLHLQWFLPQMI